MDLTPLIFTLALAIAVCAALKQAHKVPRPYEETLAKIADKYVEPQNEMWNYIKRKLPSNLKHKSPASKRSLSIRTGSLEGCGMQTMDKCYGTIPLDGSTPSNLVEEIGEIQSIQICQWFCKEIYTANCTWFLYDRTTMDCKLFEGSLDDFQNDCSEIGYARDPSISDCPSAFDATSDNACYNFREDYCRFDMDLLDNLEHVLDITQCQMACQHRTHCNFFVYFQHDHVCKLQTTNFANRVCDIVHGTPDPDFQTCLDDSKVSWNEY